jgi:DNA-binding NtrC family response regulator
MQKLMTYGWPGNIRELMNVLDRAAVLSEGSQILPCSIELPVPSAEPSVAGSKFREGRAKAIEMFERTYVQDLLRKHGGNVTRAALEARKDRRAFGRLIRKYGIDRHSP